MLTGEDGPGGIAFNDFRTAYLVGSLALAAILFEGGLSTEREMVRQALWPSVALATAGVAASPNAVHFTIRIAVTKSIRVVGCGARGRSL
jgi:cell volume regulation protein A